MGKYQHLRHTTSQNNEIWTLYINRPKKMNATAFETFAEIEKFILEEINPVSSGARVLILTGEGKHFTAGLDMQSVQQLGELEAEDPARKSIHLNNLVSTLGRQVSALEICRVPVIAVVHGFAIGAGVDLSSACDIRICSKDAKFTIKEVDLGLAADLGTLQRFQKVVGNDSWSRELAYTARFFSAEEALQHGFVSYVYDTKEASLEAAMKLAKEIASKSPAAIYTSKKSLIYSRDHSVKEGLNHIALLNGVMLQTNDPATAVAARFSNTVAKFPKL